MERMRSIYAALFGAVTAVLAAPALALAQGAGGAPSTGAGGGLATDAPAAAGGAAWMLWLLLAIALIAVGWFALSARRRASSQHR